MRGYYARFMSTLLNALINLQVMNVEKMSIKVLFKFYFLILSKNERTLIINIETK